MAFEVGICCLRTKGTEGGVLSWTCPVLKSTLSLRSKEYAPFIFDWWFIAEFLLSCSMLNILKLLLIDLKMTVQIKIAYKIILRRIMAILRQVPNQS